MNKLETALKALNVEISRYVIDKKRIIVVGGVEVIDRYSIKDFKTVNGNWEKIDIVDSGDEKTLLPFRYTSTKFSIKHLNELIEFKKKRTLSKEESLNYEVTKKDDLINKVVYVHESNPSTNSLALAKQFKLKHFHVIEQIFKLAEQNPSIFMGIKYGVYEDIRNRGGRGNKSGIESSIPLSNTKTSVSHAPFLHITEEVYYKFILNMGVPKSKSVRVYRTYKIEE